MVVIRQLEWDGWNEEHIARHAVVAEEVEDVCFSKDSLLVHVRGTRYRFIGQARAGRYLTVIVDYTGRASAYVLTARAATPAERRRHSRWRGR